VVATPTATPAATATVPSPATTAPPPATPAAPSPAADTAKADEKKDEPASRFSWLEVD
jgi:hypothetical protein